MQQDWGGGAAGGEVAAASPDVWVGGRQGPGSAVAAQSPPRGPDAAGRGDGPRVAVTQRSVVHFFCREIK